MSGTQYGDIALEAVLAEVQGLRGGKRLRQAIAKFAQIMANRDARVNSPNLFMADQAVSLSAVQVLQLPGSNLLVPSQDSAQQAVASLRVFDDGAGNYTTVYARMPGKLGNSIQLTIQTPNVASAVDSAQTTSVPKVSWTPTTGNIAASITALNTSSKLVWAVATGTGGTLGSQAATSLAGGVGEGVRIALGSKTMADNSAYGALFAGSANGTFVKSWQNDLVEVSVSNLDLVVGEAVPTGISALTAAVSTLMLRLEWSRPLHEVSIPLAVKA